MTENKDESANPSERPESLPASGNPGAPLENTADEPQVVLVAVDGSSGAARVLSAAARLCRAFPLATLHVVHVHRASRLDRAHAVAPVQSAEALQDEKEQLEAHTRAARRRCRNQVQGHFLVGDPTREILKLTHDLKVELLVIGVHDYSGFERWLLGSVAETLMRNAGCSVYVVRPKSGP